MEISTGDQDIREPDKRDFGICFLISMNPGLSTYIKIER